MTSSPAELQATGRRALLSGDALTAAACFARIVHADPIDATARHHLALALRALGDVSSALAQAEAALALKETAPGMVLVGSLRCLAGDLAGGEAVLRRAAALGHGPGHYQLGVLLWSQGQSGAAEASLKAALACPLSPLLRARVAGQLVDLQGGQPPGPLALCAVPLSAALLDAPLHPIPTGSSLPPPGAPTTLTPPQLAERIAAARCVVALTGAGISSASGLETRKQLWTRFDRDDAVSIWRFQEDPGYLWRVIAAFLGEAEATPNPAHHALATLPIAAVLTQNVDGLHQRAGSTAIELHGSLQRTRCSRCGTSQERTARDWLGGPLPPRCRCGGVVRPDVVLFGEPVAQPLVQAALRWVRQADLLLVVGCAMDVAPASALPRLAAETGAQVVELNPISSRLARTLTIARLPGHAEETLPAVQAALSS